MSLSQALSIAMSGLRANQLALSLTSSNVANSDTPGYIRKTVNQIQTSSGSIGAGVSITGVNRELDLYLQQQIRTEQSGASYADLRSSILSSLQSIYGTPGGTGTLETAFNNLVTAVQGLSTSSDSQSARIGVLNAAQSLTQQLNSMSGGIQSLRSQAESGLNSAVNTANTAMQQIVNLNTQLQSGNTSDAAAAALKDQRDQYVDQLSQLMDIRVIENGNNQIQVFTNSGVQLVGAEASTLSFNPQGTVTPNTQWDADPTKSNLGTLAVHFPNGGSLNLIQTNSIRSGTIAGYLELRDKTLVQAQTQLDQFAANMSSLLSDKTTAGTAVSSGASNGFDLDLSGLQTGNVDPSHLYGYQQRPASAVAGAGRRSVGAALVQQRHHRSQRSGDRYRFLRRHGFGDEPAQCGARLCRLAVLQHRLDAAGARQRHRNRDRERRLRDVDHIIAAGRQRRGAVVHRRQRPLYRRDHRGRPAVGGARGAHPGEQPARR